MISQESQGQSCELESCEGAYVFPENFLNRDEFLRSPQTTSVSQTFWL